MAEEEFLRRSSIAANGGFSSLDSGRCGRPGGPPGALLGAPGRCNDARCARGFGAPGGKPAIKQISLCNIFWPANDHNTFCEAFHIGLVLRIIRGLDSVLLCVVKVTKS